MNKGDVLSLWLAGAKTDWNVKKEGKQNPTAEPQMQIFIFLIFDLDIILCNKVQGTEIQLAYTNPTLYVWYNRQLLAWLY